MPRYIDAEALIEKVFPHDVVIPEHLSIATKIIYNEILKAPTCDAVPMSEVEKAKQEVARELLGEIYDLSKHSRKDMRITYSDFDEMRKKYIGEKK